MQDPLDPEQIDRHPVEDDVATRRDRSEARTKLRPGSALFRKIQQMGAARLELANEAQRPRRSVASDVSGNVEQVFFSCGR